MNKIIFGVIALFWLVSCKDGTGTINVHLTDAPGDYQEVNIDLHEVKVKMEKGSGWISLAANQRVYNLLALRNVDTLIATGSVPAGKIQEVRLILGSNNSIKLNDGSVHDLVTPSAEHSGFKIKINKKVDDDDPAKLLLDFDALLSVTEANGKYILNPTIVLK
jgi:hypothetical protein